MSFKRFIVKFLGLFPSKLPVGVAEFDLWAKSISESYDLPTKDEDSIRFTLASILMHLGAQTAYKSKFFFALTMKAAAAKQVAGSVFYEIKTKQKALEAKVREEAESNGQAK